MGQIGLVSIEAADVAPTNLTLQKPHPETKATNASGLREVALLNKSRADVSADHLMVLLLTMGGSSSAYDLWHRSDMVVDEFYKQLRQEIAGGSIAIQPSTKLLEVQRAP